LKELKQLLKILLKNLHWRSQVLQQWQNEYDDVVSFSTLPKHVQYGFERSSLFNEPRRAWKKHKFKKNYLWIWMN
jgi:hypothetical protein